MKARCEHGAPWFADCLWCGPDVTAERAGLAECQFLVASAATGFGDGSTGATIVCTHPQWTGTLKFCPEAT